MSREYFMTGTNADDFYCDLVRSEQLFPFLYEQGATNPEPVKSFISKLAGDFTKLPGFQEQSEYDYPVAFRYLPMHLYKRDDMPKRMKPVYAVSVSGTENTRRNSNYSCVALMDEGELLQKGESAYLTQIFGTPLTSWQEIRDIREGKSKGRWDLTKAEISLNDRDKELVLAVIDAIYQDKTVLLRLEKNVPFNRRAVQLLRQIYSLMEPRLATETGFSSYQDPSKIQEMVRTAGLRIFVLPADAATDAASGKFVLMDLGASEEIRPDNDSEAVKCLRRWSTLPPDDRLAVYQGIFHGAYDFSKPEHFVARSNEFFADYSSLMKALRDTAKDRSLEELYTLYRSYPLLVECGDWYSERFRALLQKDRELKNAALEAAATEITKTVQGVNGGRDTASPDMERFNFARLLLGSEAMGALAKRASDQAAAMQFEQIDKPTIAALETRLAAAEEEKKIALAAQKAEYDKKLAELQNKLNAAEEEKKKALAALKAEYDKKLAELQNKLNAAEEEKRKALAALKKEYETKLAAAEEEKKKALAALKKEYETKLTAQKKEYEDKIAALTKEYEDKTAEIRAKAKEYVNELKAKLAAAEKERDDAAAKLTAAEKELVKKESEIDSLQSDIRALEKENRILKGKEPGMTIEDQKQKIRRLTNENEDLNRRLHGQEDEFGRVRTKTAILAGVGGLVLAALIFVGLFFLAIKPNFEEQKAAEQTLLEEKLKTEADARLESALADAEEKAEAETEEKVAEAVAELEEKLTEMEQKLAESAKKQNKTARKAADSSQKPEDGELTDEDEQMQTPEDAGTEIDGSAAEEDDIRLGEPPVVNSQGIVTI